MRKLCALFAFELRLSFRNVFNLIFALAFPPAMILLFGNIYGNEPSALFHGYGTVDVSVPAFICLIAAVTGLMNLPITLCTYRENQVLKRLRATTLSPADIIGTQLAVNLLMTVIGIVLLVVVAYAAFGSHPIGSAATAILLTLFVICGVFSMGAWIASVCKTVKTATVAANILYFPMIFLSGATFPMELMPDGVQKWSRFLPLTHAVAVLKNAWLGKPFDAYADSFLVLAALLAVCGTLSVILFQWE